MLNWRHESYVQLPVDDSAIMRSLSLLGRAFVTYATKHCARGGDGTIELHRMKPGDDHKKVAQAFVHYVGGSTHDVAVLARVMQEVTEFGAVTIGPTSIKVTEFAAWQKPSRDPWRRLYAREKGTFIDLDLTTRMIAAYCIKSCDDDGLFRGTDDVPTLAARLLRSAGTTAGKMETDRRVVKSALQQLFVEGFLSVDRGCVEVKNFTSAQTQLSKRDVTSPDVPRATPQRAPDVPPTSRNHAQNPEESGVSLAFPFSTSPPSPQTTEETPTVSLRSAAVVAHAPTRNDPTRVVPVVPPTAHAGGESRVATLRLVPDAATQPVAPQRPHQTSMSSQPTGASMQPSLFADLPQPATAPTAPSEAPDATEPAPKPRSARKAPSSGEKAPKVKAPPKEKPPARGANPEQTIACVSALAAAAGRRFAMGDFAMWHKIVKTNASKTVLDYPDVALWKLVGEALAANADGGYAVLGPSRVTTRWFSDQLCVAHEWVASGRQRPTDNRPFVAKTNATTIPEGHRKNAPSAAQRLANATGKAVYSGMRTTFDNDDHDYDLSAPDCPVRLAQ